MQNYPDFIHRSALGAIAGILRKRLLPLITTGLILCVHARSENKYLQHNLVSDVPGIADFVDPDLTNPWGIAASPTSPLWISNNHSGTAKIYDTSGKPSTLVVSVRAPGYSPSSPASFQHPPLFLEPSFSSLRDPISLYNASQKRSGDHSSSGSIHIQGPRDPRRTSWSSPPCC